MSNGVIVPLNEAPRFDDLFFVIKDGFKEFSLLSSGLFIGMQAASDMDVLKGDLFIQQFQKNAFCTVAFSRPGKPKHDRNLPPLDYVAQIMAINEESQWLMALIAYSLCHHYGSFVYDPALLFGSPKAYSLDEFRPMIQMMMQCLNHSRQAA